MLYFDKSFAGDQINWLLSMHFEGLGLNGEYILQVVYDEGGWSIAHKVSETLSQ